MPQWGWGRTSCQLHPSSHRLLREKTGWLEGSLVSIKQRILGTEVLKSNGEMGVAQALLDPRFGMLEECRGDLAKGLFSFVCDMTSLLARPHCPSESAALILDCAQGLLAC